MNKRLNKIIKKGFISEEELNNFIKTLSMLSLLNIIPYKPKKVINKLVGKKKK
jgi:hypothetical protein